MPKKRDRLSKHSKTFILNATHGRNNSKNNIQNDQIICQLITILPSMLCFSLMTLSATAGSEKTMKPNPRARPVVRSFMITASITSPNVLKYSLRRSSFVSHEIPPMNSLPRSDCIFLQTKHDISHQTNKSKFFKHQQQFHHGSNSFTYNSAENMQLLVVAQVV